MKKLPLIGFQIRNKKPLSWEPRGNLKTIAYDAEECRKEVARIVIIDELSFRHT